jgi:hypothetical protein
LFRSEKTLGEYDTSSVKKQKKKGEKVIDEIEYDIGFGGNDNNETED